MATRSKVNRRRAKPKEPSYPRVSNFLNDPRFCNLDFKSLPPGYWLSRSMDERLAAMEYLRQEHWGYAACSAPMKMVLEVVDLQGRVLDRHDAGPRKPISLPEARKSRRPGTRRSKN